MPKTDDSLLSGLFTEYRQMMFKIALNILHNRSDAEDVVQDAFLWIINNIVKISQIPCYERGNYFASITEHRSIDVLRKRSRHPTEDIEEQYELSSDERVEESALSSVTVEEIKSALNELSNRDYELLYLYLFKEMTPKEIGEAMGISENNIRVYVQRARKRFAKILHKRGLDHEI
ncbi:MAG: sigma-70 family RNA polymerase sigma factor [Oscillospiraceae bacterium]|nr:sigma-70 family RNA polymerase sigma factor [Oscillospiraceae bacterium]